MNRTKSIGVIATVVACSAAISPGAVIWNSSINGPLSENPASPTAFTLSAGTNSIISVVGGGNGETGINQNWVNVTIPDGFQLSEYVLAAYSSTDQQGFTGFQAGASFAGGELAVNTESSYLGYTHYGIGATNGSLPPTNLVGDDLLPLMANPALAVGATGFTPPVPAGTYTFLIQQLGATTNYQFDFDVTSVPEPASIGLFSLAPLLIGRRRRIRVAQPNKPA
ncbi:MAG TPA: PEP-CTERM sorting domain-containing protein [Tepidisphaeraceae bacterium]|nr:PEP-CTERM sorting domain-containing protein [Tepidisphaeraceae bacterium]